MTPFDIKLNYKLQSYAGFVQTAQARYFERMIGAQLQTNMNRSFDKFYESSKNTYLNINKAVEDLKYVNKKVVSFTTIISKFFNRLPWWLKLPLRFPLFMGWLGFKAAGLAIHSATKAWNNFLGLGNSAFSTWRSSLGTGSSFGGFNAFNISARYASINPDAIINNVARGKYDRTSLQWQGIRTLGVSHNIDTTEMSMAVIVATAKWAKKQTEFNLDIMAEATGINSLLNNDEIHSLRNMSQSDLDKMEDNYKLNKDRMSLKVDEAREWTVFTTKLSIMNKTIQTRFTSKLTPLAKKITEFSDVLVTRFIQLMNTPFADNMFNLYGDMFKKFFMEVGSSILDDILTFQEWMKKFHYWVDTLFKNYWFKWYLKITGAPTRAGAIDEFIKGPSYGSSWAITNPIERYRKSHGVWARSPEMRKRLRAGAGEDPYTGSDLDPGKLSSDFHGIRMSRGATAGGPSEEGTVELAKIIQSNDPGGIFTAFHDLGPSHRIQAPTSPHNSGRAFDYVPGNRSYESHIAQIDKYLHSLGFERGAFGSRYGDYQFEPMAMAGNSHIHFQWVTKSAAERFYKKVHGEKKIEIPPGTKKEPVSESKKPVSKTVIEKRKDDFSSLPAIRNFSGNDVICYSTPYGSLPE